MSGLCAPCVPHYRALLDEAGGDGDEAGGDGDEAGGDGAEAGGDGDEAPTTDLRPITPRCHMCGHLASNRCGHCDLPMCAVHTTAISTIGEIFCDDCLLEWAAQQEDEALL